MTGRTGRIGELPDFFGDPAVACRRPDVDPETFWPGRGQNATEAKAVCRSCDFEVRCRRWAIAARVEHGVWGGTTPEEREATWRTR